MTSKVRVTFLGTGTSQGVPIIGCKCPVCCSNDPKDKRLRSSVLVEVDDLRFVIDTGPDFRQQMLRIDADRLDAVLFTHSHKDHCAGFDDIRAFNYIQKKAMDVFADEKMELALRRDFFYVFEENKYPGVPEIRLFNFKNEPFSIQGVRIVPILVFHYRMPVYGFRIGDFTYITDANFIAPEELEKIKGSKVMVLNALRKEQHISHFNLQEALNLAEEGWADKTYLTHISHQLGFHKEVSAGLPSFASLAHDGLVIEV
jgi:phosphoribosyl 1,2-cyclic phosphate phosphodiesterase